MKITLIDILLKEINDLSSNVVFLTKQVNDRDKVLNLYSNIVEGISIKNNDSLDIS